MNAAAPIPVATVESVIAELRLMQGLGLITSEHCVRAEQYVEKHRDLFWFNEDPPRTTSDWADYAVEHAL